jgi:hypothetical protein
LTGKRNNSWEMKKLLEKELKRTGKTNGKVMKTN